MQVKIAGKELKLRFGMHLGEMLLEHFTKKPNVGRIEFMALLIYYAHENYCLGYDTEPAVSRGEVFTYLEDYNNDEKLAEELKGVIEAYNASRPAQAFEQVNGSAKKNEPTIATSASTPLE